MKSSVLNNNIKCILYLTRLFGLSWVQIPGPHNKAGPMITGAGYQWDIRGSSERFGITILHRPATP